MTRFARAKGSKSSNERIPEDATSWQEMKNQLLESQNRKKDELKQKEFDEIRAANYKSFLDSNKPKSEVTWAAFPNETNINKKKSQIVKEINSFCDENSTVEDNAKFESLKSEIEKSLQKIEAQTKKTRKRSLSKFNTLGDQSESVGQISPKNKKNKPQQKVIQSLNNEGHDESIRENTCTQKKKNKPKQKVIQSTDDAIQTVTNQGESEREGTYKKKKKNKSKENVPSEDASQTKNGQTTMKNGKQNKKARNQVGKIQENPSGNRKISKTANFKSKENKFKQENKNTVEEYPKQNQNKKGNKQQGKRRRKDDMDKKLYIEINGVKEELVRFDGFPIKKSDAERLRELKEQMRTKGIPRVEIERTLKLERRRAEKALTRDKKKVCFHCRMAGHLLSECPQLDKSTEIIGQTSTGICFKCGSTEHTHFECKIVKGMEFKFAQCFICKEQGHISRQCPDNPRGLYPQGGGCRLCGDVTHLKKDCPQLHEGRQDTAIRLSTLSQHDHLEDLDSCPASGPKVTPQTKRLNKIVKF